MVCESKSVEKESSNYFCLCFKRKNDKQKKESVDRVHCFATDTIQKKSSNDGTLVRSRAFDNLSDFTLEKKD